jgi:membrane protein YqaA with SNARE-associated domain
MAMTEALDTALYGGLFLVAFLAATILPLQSEAALVAALLLERHSTWALVAVASAGNVLGSTINWWIGRAMATDGMRARLGIDARRFEQARRWYERYGHWSLLLSWLPVIGDPLTLIAGALRTPLPRFLLLVVVAKVGRYAVIAAATTAII